MADYGYGDAAPDSAKYGYDDAAPDHDPYGYGDARPDTDMYGYGDDTYETGYNDQSSTRNTMQPDHRSHNNRRNQNHAHAHHERHKSGGDDISVHSAATAESYGDYGDEPDPQQPRRQRYRRRGSVTKYSLDAQDTVQKEYDEHDQILNQFRGLQDIPQSPMPMDSTSVPDSPLQDDSHDLVVDLPDAKDHKKKGKKKGLRRFTIGF